MGLGDLLDDAVGTKESEAPAGLGGQASEVRRGEVCGRMVDEAPDVAVSGTGRGELTTGNGVEQSEIGGIVQTQSTEAAAVLDDRAGNGIEELRAGCGVFDRGEGV